MSNKTLKQLAADVVLAWSIEGRCPEYHRNMKDRAKSLDELSEEYYRNHD